MSTVPTLPQVPRSALSNDGIYALIEIETYLQVYVYRVPVPLYSCRNSEEAEWSQMCNLMGWLPREALWNRMITRICNEVIFSFYPSVQEPGYHVLQQLPERVQHEGNCSGAADLMSKGHEGLHVGLIEGGGEVAEGRSWIRTSHPSYCRSGTRRGSAEYHCCPAGSMGKHTAISFPKVRLLLSLSRSTM